MKKIIYASSVSASVNIVAVTVITIWAELAPGLKNILVGITGHHWITKSLMVVVLFPVVLTLVHGFSRRVVTDKAISRSLWTLVVLAIAGFAVILGFFVWHFLKG